MNNTAAANTNTVARAFKDRDDYGRGMVRFTGTDGRTLGVVVTLPRRTAHVRPAGENYLVNDWTGSTGDAHNVTYYAKRADALAHMANVARANGATEVRYS